MQLKPIVQMFYTKGNISGDSINKAIFNACFSSVLCPLNVFVLLKRDNSKARNLEAEQI